MTEEIVSRVLCGTLFYAVRLYVIVWGHCNGVACKPLPRLEATVSITTTPRSLPNGITRGGEF